MTDGVPTEREEEAGWSALALFSILDRLGVESAGLELLRSDVGLHNLFKHLPEMK